MSWRICYKGAANSQLHPAVAMQEVGPMLPDTQIFPDILEMYTFM